MAVRAHALRDINDHQEVYALLAKVMGQPDSAPGENINALVGLVLFNELRELNTTLGRIEQMLIDRLLP